MLIQWCTQDPFPNPNPYLDQEWTELPYGVAAIHQPLDQERFDFHANAVDVDYYLDQEWTEFPEGVAAVHQPLDQEQFDFPRRRCYRSPAV